MTYGNFKDLFRLTAYDKILRDETFNIAKRSKYDGYKQGIASLVYELSEKLAEDLHKPIIRKPEKRKLYSYNVNYTIFGC